MLTSVNCSATVARAIADHFRRDVRPQALAEYPNVDGVIALTHGLGCGIDMQGEGIAILRRTLAGYAAHPNFASVLFIGLGCETNQIGGVLEAGGLDGDKPRLRAFTIQDSGGTRKTIERGIALVREMLADANRVQREPVCASHLCVGLQCGGSDGYSGISANPALGAAVDRLVRHGGTAILSETPEIYGAEHLLTRRAASPAVGEKLLARIAWWEDYCQRNGAELDNNPSAGNKAGGLTTILESRSARSRKAAPRSSWRSTNMRSRSMQRALCSWIHLAMTRCLQRARSRRAQPDLFHDRPWIGLWLCAVAIVEAGDQYGAMGAAGRRHRHQLRRRDRWHREHR